MGGNALKVPSVRLDAEAYNELAIRIEAYFIDVNVIPSYTNKTSFGDMDVLVDSDHYNTEVLTECLRSFGFTLSQDPVINGNVTSFGVVLPEGVFQIDFISVKWAVYDFALNYFSYNDLGNLLGRVARSVGLKLGHDGLWYIQRAPDNDSIVLKEHLITSDWQEALEILGYSYREYCLGFDSLEDVFKYVMSSPYYNFNKFDLSQRNAKARIRDAKRPNYHAFLEYAQKNPKTNEIPSKSEFLNTLFVKSPWFQSSFKRCLDKHDHKKMLKSKYNGHIIKGLTGLEGKEVAKFMEDRKYVFTETYLENTSKDEVGRMITFQYNVEFLRMGRNV